MMFTIAKNVLLIGTLLSYAKPTNASKDLGEIRCEKCKGRKKYKTPFSAKLEKCSRCNGKGTTLWYFGEDEKLKKQFNRMVEYVDIDQMDITSHTIPSKELTFTCCQKHVGANSKVGDTLYYHHDPKSAKSDADFVKLKIMEFHIPTKQQRLQSRKHQQMFTTSVADAKDFLKRMQRKSNDEKKTLTKLTQKGCIVCGTCKDTSGMTLLQYARKTNEKPLSKMGGIMHKRKQAKKIRKVGPVPEGPLVPDRFYNCPCCGLWMQNIDNYGYCKFCHGNRRNYLETIWEESGSNHTCACEMTPAMKKYRTKKYILDEKEIRDKELYQYLREKSL